MKDFSNTNLESEGMTSGTDEFEQRIMAKNAAIRDMIQGDDASGAGSPAKDADSVASFKERLGEVERREAAVQLILSDLKDIFNTLAQREEMLNRREARLNEEYQKIKEIEGMIKDSTEIADSLSGVLPSADDREDSQGDPQDTDLNKSEEQ
jgi:hypothetical protein